MDATELSEEMIVQVWHYDRFSADEKLGIAKATFKEIRFLLKDTY